MKSGLRIFRSSRGPWGLAALGAAGPDRQAEGSKGTELAGEPCLTHEAPRSGR